MKNTLIVYYKGWLFFVILIFLTSDSFAQLPTKKIGKEIKWPIIVRKGINCMKAKTYFGF
jgi:hypothetical protein